MKTKKKAKSSGSNSPAKVKRNTSTIFVKQSYLESILAKKVSVKDDYVLVKRPSGDQIKIKHKNFLMAREYKDLWFVTVLSHKPQAVEVSAKVKSSDTVTEYDYNGTRILVNTNRIK